MKVGILKEISSKELRVAATPVTVDRLKKLGFEVFVESQAGVRANYSNKSYQDSGATVVDSATDIYTNVDIILKILPFTENEISCIKEGTVTLSYLFPAQNTKILEKLADRKVNAIAMDAIPRISRAQKMDVLSSMANIAGYRSVIEAANHFGRFLNGQITAAGKIEPAKVMVIGAGVAGLSALGVASSMGAVVRAFDTRKEVKEQIISMGASFLSVSIDEDGSTDTGYSKVMSQKFIDAEMKLFEEQAKEVDIIITTAQIPGKEAPKLLLDYHVKAMKKGSVIVDLAASSGGNCTKTHPGEVYVTDNGVTIIGKISQLPEQASRLYGNNLYHLLNDMGGADKFKINMEDDIIKRSMVTYNGNINWPPQPLPVQGNQKLDKSLPAEKHVDNISKKKNNFSIIGILTMAILLIFAGQFAPHDFLQHLTVFVLSIFVGWQVIWNVAASLHTPLMSATNAISGIVIIGGILQMKNDSSALVSILAMLAVFVAGINIIGGFSVTNRMLKMFRR